MNAGKLRIAERCCSVVAIIALVLLLIVVSGEDGSRGAAFALLAVLVVSFTASMLIQRRLNRLAKAAHKAMPVSNVHAEVVGRRIRHIYSVGRSNVRTTRDLWLISFRTADGGTLELSVPCEIYYGLQEGAKGILRHKGQEFISFR